jgi:dCTP deaminase
MTLLNDYEIDQLQSARAIGGNPMLDPYVPHQVSSRDGRKIISYGLGSAGYDIRVDDEFKIFSPIPGNAGGVVDPKDFNPQLLTTFVGDSCDVPPHSYVLCKSKERFIVPEDIAITCIGKSTYARCGLHVNVTPLEPGWEGILTIEISNATPSPVRIYADEGIAQILFFQLSGRVKVSYRDRKGKYQNQVGIVPARMKE